MPVARFGPGALATESFQTHPCVVLGPRRLGPTTNKDFHVGRWRARSPVTGQSGAFRGGLATCVHTPTPLELAVSTGS